MEWNPELFPRKHRKFRLAVIRRSYYGAFFALEPGVTTVVAVVDLRQSPGALRDILRARTTES